MTRFVFAALLLALTACGGTQTAAQGASGGQNESGDAVIAEVGGRKVTLKELDTRWQTMDPAEKARVTQLLYQNRRNALDQLLGELLIEDAAKAAGLSSAQLLEQQLPKRAQPVTDADILQFYNSNKDRTEGRTIDQLRDPIRAFLTAQREQQARAQLIDELKTKRAGEVRVLLDPPRQNVELALHDPSLGPLSAPVTIVEFSDYQ